VFEAAQRKRHRVDTWTKVDDGISTLVVGDDGADFLDKDWTGGFHGDTRHDRAAGISDQAADRALREDAGRSHEQE
jgi:hypothetical protein